MKLQSLLKTITNIALTALIVAPLGHPPAKGQSSGRFGDRAAQLAGLGYSPIFGDFDGDSLLDQAQPHLAGAHQCIRVRFGNSLESHLEFGPRGQSPGALLARDINQDNNADLIWVYQSRSEPAVVWLGDGLGHFAKAAEWNADGNLRGMLFGDGDPAVGGDSNDERVYLAPQLASSELPHAQNVEDDILKAPEISSHTRRRDLGLFLSYLRERGPPSFNYFV